MKDNRTACLKVILARKEHDPDGAIPRTLEPQPVVTEVTGELRPFK